MNAVATGSRAALWIVSTGLGLLLLSSLVQQPLTHLQIAALSIFAGLSLLSPLHGLLLLAALGPIITVIGVLFGFTFTGSRLLETFVLLLLLSWSARQVSWIRSAQWRALDWALLGFAVVVATSAAAHLPVLALRSGSDSTVPAIWRFLTTVYLERPPGFDVIIDAVLLLEGIGICVLVSRLANNGADARSIAGMVIAGATGAALMNAYRLFEVALRRDAIVDTLAATFTSLRLNTQFADLNAAGSYFALALVAAVGLANIPSRRGTAYAAAAVVLALSLWLSGSRSALAGAALGIIAGWAVRHWEGTSRVIRSRRRLLMFAAVAVAMVATLIVLSKTRNNTMRYSVFARTELTLTGLRMLGDRPLLGVGVSRFYDLFPQYASPELRQAFYESALIPVTHENAHNNFLQILSELGIVGFAAFLLVLWLALRPDRLSVDPSGVRAAMVMAVGTFLLSALFGHPLLTHEVAYPFWMVVGLASAGAPDLQARSATMIRVACATLALALLGSIPLRANIERREATLEGVALGMSGWLRDEAGNRFRRAGLQSTIFVESRAPVLTLPLRVAAETCDVEIGINGRAVDRVTIPSDFWQEVRIRLTPGIADRRSSRIDLRIEGPCTGTPSDPARPLMVGRPGEMGVPSGSALPR